MINFLIKVARPALRNYQVSARVTSLTDPVVGVEGEMQSLIINHKVSYSVLSVTIKNLYLTKKRTYFIIKFLILFCLLLL